MKAYTLLLVQSGNETQRGRFGHLQLALALSDDNHTILDDLFRADEAQRVPL